MKKPNGPVRKLEDIELHPDAWERFESAVKKAVQAAPMHRPAKKLPEPPKPKRRASR